MHPHREPKLNKQPPILTRAVVHELAGEGSVMTDKKPTNSTHIEEFGFIVNLPQLPVAPTIKVKVFWACGGDKRKKIIDECQGS